MLSAEGKDMSEITKERALRALNSMWDEPFEGGSAREAVEAYIEQSGAHTTDAPCPRCSGSEFVGYKRGVRCTTCNGTGRVEQSVAQAGELPERSGTVRHTVNDGPSTTEVIWVGEKPSAGTAVYLAAPQPAPAATVDEAKERDKLASIVRSILTQGHAQQMDYAAGKYPGGFEEFCAHWESTIAPRVEQLAAIRDYAARGEGK